MALEFPPEFPFHRKAKPEQAPAAPPVSQAPPALPPVAQRAPLAKPLTPRPIARVPAAPSALPKASMLALAPAQAQQAKAQPRPQGLGTPVPRPVVAPSAKTGAPAVKVGMPAPKAAPKDAAPRVPVPVSVPTQAPTPAAASAALLPPIPQMMMAPAPAAARPQGADRRRAPRQTLVAKATIRPDTPVQMPSLTSQGFVSNISMNGIGFHTRKPLETGGKYRITLELGPLKWACRLRVVSCRHHPDTETFDCGAEFIGNELHRQPLLAA